MLKSVTIVAIGSNNRGKEAKSIAIEAIELDTFRKPLDDYV